MRASPRANRDIAVRSLPDDRDDGHPILLVSAPLLGTSIVDTPLVLPISASLIAFAAVALFMWFAPFPWWFRCIFDLHRASGVRVFRDGAKLRDQHARCSFSPPSFTGCGRRIPFRLAFILALLANTDVHSAMLQLLLAAAWAWDIVVDQKRASSRSSPPADLPFAIVGAGVLLCLFVTMPRENTILTPGRLGKHRARSGLRCEAPCSGRT